MERLHPTLKKLPDDVHAVHLFLRNQLEILHPTIKGLYLHHFTVQDLVFPGSFLLNQLGGVKGNKAKNLSVHVGVADVKPSPPPVLDRFRHGKGKGKKIRTKGDDATPNGIHTIRARLLLHGIELPEEAKVWLDAEPTLAESDETSNMKKRIGRKMMQLDAIEKEQPTKEVVDWEGKPTNNEGKKHNLIPSGGTGDYLIVGESMR